MREFCCLFVILLTALLQADEQRPYVAAIQSDNTAVLSGPGTEFYPASALQNGDKVEVYYEKNGYLAIRPPVGSYSWISAKFVRLDSDNSGTVTANGLASLVGSSLTEDCSTVQVRLKSGEKVLVLDRKETPENPESPVWLKIAPPSGEFRWIEKSAILPLTPNIQQVRYDQVADKTARRTNGTSAAVNTATSVPLPLPKRLKPETDDLETIIETKIASSSRSMIATVPAEPEDPFRKALNELERETQTVMTRPADDAVFEVLIKRGEELYQVAPTDRDLEKTFHLVESLKRTRQIRQELAMSRPAATRSGGQAPLNAGSYTAPQSVPTVTPTALAGHTAEQRFDITGKLGAFDPLPEGYPPYAVVNGKGEITCLVSPDTGLDLNQHVGKTVGINGILGFYERPNKPRAKHITAKNVQIR
jgi:hypothetical protein